MKLSSALQLATAAIAALFAPAVAAQNSTYYNPILPGWHSDPSCIQQAGTFYCVTSTFIAFPGLPIYASKDLINWRLISHAWNREAQLPGDSWGTVGQQEGMFAATIRYNNGSFYVICEYLGSQIGTRGVIFKTTDPYSDAAWSVPVTFRPQSIDPDLFWDDDGKVYVAIHGVQLYEINMNTGALSSPTNIWNGTGGVWPEGPHIYKKDGYYYLLIAEGGTATDHSVTMARAKNIKGPYEAYNKNPVLTNRNTNEYFQTVGHADLFQDVAGNWWGVALATRSGRAWQVYPMGRETVLFPVTWATGGWPIASTVRGRMSGWPLPTATKDIKGDGPFVQDPDVYDFEAGSDIPKHFMYWRVPRNGSISVAAAGGLQVVPSRNNVTGQLSPTELTGRAGLSFVGRRQTHTRFTYSVDLEFAPTANNQEAGVTIFLTQYNHIDLGVVRLNNALSLRLRGESTGNGQARPQEKTVAIPTSWGSGAIRLELAATSATEYTFAASPVSGTGSRIVVGTAPARVVSGGAGSFVGSLVGVYATCNGAGSGTACPAGGNALFKRWRYTGVSQQISDSESIASV